MVHLPINLLAIFGLSKQKLLIGLFFLLFITFENLILSRKKTAVIVIIDQIFFSWIAYFILCKNSTDIIGPLGIWLFSSLACFAFIIYIKYKNHTSEESDLDYIDRIYSVSAVVNKLHKPKPITVGRILPVNHNEIPFNMKAIELDDTVLSGATMLTGATGSGKTTTLEVILKQGIDAGKPIVFFDYKGEEGILDNIKSFADAAGIPYYEFSSRGCTFTYDPFKNLNETGKVEALLNTRRWSLDGADEHYKTSMQLAIQNLVRSYDEYRRDNNEVCNYIAGLYKYAKMYHPQSNERDGFNNLIKSLEILLSSKAKDLFGDVPTFTFEDDKQYVVCFSFTSANKHLANNLSSFVFTDLMDRGTRRHYPNKLLLCVDEFGTLEASTVIKDILEKGRSGGVQTVFSILDINQIAMTSGEHFVQAILGTINNYIIHAGATQYTAELLAGVQKYEKDYDIMSLRKPYKKPHGRFIKPTALFITKYNILSKRNNQDVYRISPFIECLKHVSAAAKEQENVQPEQPELPEVNFVDELNVDYVVPVEELDLTQPIKNVDLYL